MAARYLWNSLGRLVAVGLMMVASRSGVAQPTVPGTTTLVYASGVSRPFEIDIADDGSLIVGNANGGAASIYRVPPGGKASESVGEAVPDPDSVAFDRDGTITQAGAVLIGGTDLAGGDGSVWTIRPDATALRLVGPSGVIGNVLGMRFDDRGRLLLVNFHDGSIVSVSRGFANQLEASVFIAAEPGVRGHSMDIELQQRQIALLDEPGERLRRWDLDGNRLSDVVVELKNRAPIAFGRGEFWGDGLFSIDRQGRLVRLEADGRAAVVGTGFGEIGYLKFSSTGQLYLSNEEAGQILVVDPALRVGVRVKSVEVRWNSLPGVKYKVFWKSRVDGSSSEWNELMEVEGDGSIMAVTDQVERNDSRVYQVVQVPES